MAKKMSDESGDKKKNGVNPEALKKYVGQFDVLDQDDLALHMKYMTDKKDIATERKQMFKMAKAEGVPTKELKALLAEREDRKKIKARRENLDLDQRSIFEQMIDALGGEKGLVGLPLAAAAIDKAKAESGLTAEEQAAANVVNLKGMKTLDTGAPAAH